MSGGSGTASNAERKLTPVTKADLKKNPRLGRCYELSGREVAQGRLPHATLIHGSIQGFDCPRNPHAFVEFVDEGILESLRSNPRMTEDMCIESATMVFDPVADMTLPKDAYYRIFNAEEDTRYTPDEVNAISARTGNWGPWE